MEQQTKLLEVDDVVYSRFAGKLNGKFKIIKVDEYFAYTSCRKFNRITQNGYVQEAILDSDSICLWKVETHELHTEFVRTMTLISINRHDLSKLHTDQLERILQIINETK